MSEENTQVNPQEQDACQKLYSQVEEAEKAKDYSLAVSLCERLVYEFDYFGGKMRLPGLYYENGDYDKTISFVTDWRNDLLAKNDEAQFNLVMPNVMLDEVQAMKKLGHMEEALSRAESICTVSRQVIANVKRSIGESGNFSFQELPLALALAEIGEIYYTQNNYDKAGDYFLESRDVRLTYKTGYYLGYFCLHALGGASKNIAQAEQYLDAVSSSETEDILANNTTDEIELIGKSCLLLGEIYSTENGYKNKEKALIQYKKAQALGINISDEEIDQKIESIDYTPPETQQKKPSGGCYVATCVYGSYDCSQVWTLRRYRDTVLSESVFGRMFIQLYYAVSPTAVRWFGDCAWFHKMLKPILDKLVNKLQSHGVEDTPYYD